MTGRAAWRLISGRRRSRDHESSQAEEILYLVPSKDPLPEDLLLAAERSAGLRSAVKRLDDRCRHLVTALFISPEPPDYASIAEELGLAEGSIGSLRKRCLERLRRILAAPTMPDAFSDASADTVIEAGGERGRHDR
jgi:RNA polymerase sigma factor (sigma-70 family)